jgi:hypothetical protein
MLNKKVIIFFIGLIFLTSFITSQTFERKEIIDLKVPFEVNGKMASGSAWCNISIQQPNSTFIKENDGMTNLDNGNFNITLTNSETDALGTYDWIAFCCDEGLCASGSGSFEVTATGKDFSDGEALVSIGILIGALGLAFLFMFLGFKLTQNSSALPIGFFFIILSLILGIYSLNLGYAFTNDILQYESLTPVASAIYTSFLWLIIGITIISLALMLIAFIKELGKMSKKKKFGENFNPITDTYE